MSVWTPPKRESLFPPSSKSKYEDMILGNLQYLKDQVDSIGTITFNDASASKVIDGTVYQNGTKKRLIFITISISSGTTESVNLFTDANASPTKQVAKVGSGDAAGGAMILQAVMIVQPNHYYKITSTGTPTLNYWMEWDF